jgi:hypothetical protein
MNKLTVWCVAGFDVSCVVAVGFIVNVSKSLHIAVDQRFRLQRIEHMLTVYFQVNGGFNKAPPCYEFPCQGLRIMR